LRLGADGRLSVGGLAGGSVAQQVAPAREGLASIALGEEAVVTDAVEAVGQDMEEKAAGELAWGKPHDAASAAAAIVLVGERHLIVVDGDEPRIGDRGAMGVAREIGQDAFGAAEGRLGVDDEGAVAKRAQALGESGRLGERGEIAEETEFAAKETSSPRRKAASKSSRNRRRKTFDRARTESRKLGLQRIHR